MAIKRLQQVPQQQQQSKRKQHGSVASKALYFVLGCLVSFVVLFNVKLMEHQSSSPNFMDPAINRMSAPPPPRVRRKEKQLRRQQQEEQQRIQDMDTHNNETTTTTKPFSQLRVLVALVAYDFSQIPHLEQVLDAYSDLSVAVEFVNVVIYTTVPWPVLYLDMMQTRFASTKFHVVVQVFSPSLRLYLVNEHRPMFYQDIDNYDVFIYSEDDILVPPTTVATYYEETLKLPTFIVPSKEDSDHSQPQDYNIGVVRYEYQYPVDIIDDSTRHVTQNVSRIYWEHLQEPAFERIPSLPQKQQDGKDGDPSPAFVSMRNHHQGMYMATRFLLKAWKTKCEFDVPKNRPHKRGNPGQPSEGTQRVWISSNQLFGGRHCNVKQVFPVAKFGALTVWHLPNKNYRRLGRKGRLGRGTNYNATTKDIAAVHHEQQQQAQPNKQHIPTALQWHAEFRKMHPNLPWSGTITMEDHVHGPGSNAPLLKRRMSAYFEYVERGGRLSEEDFQHTELVEEV